MNLSGSQETLEQMRADGTNEIYIMNDNGTLVAYAVGNKPTTALAMEACAYETQAE